MHLTIYCDGGSKGNPGYGYGSYEISSSLGVLAKAVEKKLGDDITCNQAEYLILIEALNKAQEYTKCNAITVYTDSLLVVEQMTGKWRCKNPILKRLRDEARAVAKLVFTTIKWNSREVNVEKFGH